VTSDPKARVRTLVRFPNWLGDIVMALPAWQALRAWPDAGGIAVAVPSAFAAIARMIEGVDEVVPLVSSGRAWGRSFGEDVERLRSGAFDRAILLTNSFGSAWMTRRAGIAERWGYRADLRAPMLTRAVSRRTAGPSDADRHHSSYYLRLVQGLGIDVEDGGLATRTARLNVPDRVAGRAADLLADRGVRGDVPIVGFAPGAAFGQAKRWPPDHVAAVADALVRRAGAACVLIGSAGDRDTGVAIESALPAAGRAAVVNLIGGTDVALLAAVLGKCQVAVSNDSGAMHVAAAVGTPVVVPFGPTDERATAPLGPHTILSEPVFCRPCHLRTCPIDHRCMRRITPERVLEAVMSALAARGVRS
jgi:heptosyltransferase-2